MVSSIFYINLSWAVVGIIDRDVHNSLQSMKRPDEPIEVTIERYVVGYLVFWHIAYISRHSINKETFQRLLKDFPKILIKSILMM
ncbi:MULTISPECIES: hypothetical protein [Bacteroides]|uniref:Uncharacterized protein n=1 Tax=Bacteroides cellulosilyticus CL02T12C19 TaxID=997874 RepID=I9FRP5_9BACE|nr:MULTISPECIES: hypothetical protein [Bacteroides]EIY36374.1 hypothetical protein HMPREF1062_01054 [Bacteroides cellulosilyticus CL02T12C19]MCA6028542.1 hypothetical protein [Bacteroides thetaiotaomicron]